MERAHEDGVVFAKEGDAQDGVQVEEEAKLSGERRGTKQDTHESFSCETSCSFSVCCMKHRRLVMVM